MKTSLPDTALNILYGQLTLTFAYTAFLAVRESEATSKLSRVILVVTAGHVVVFGYILLTGKQGLRRSGRR